MDSIVNAEHYLIISFVVVTDFAAQTNIPEIMIRFAFCL